MAANQDRRAAHEALLEALRAAGHDVELWADDPDLLRAYAEAIGFEVRASKKIRVKYSRGLGGWVVYVGYNFTDGAFSQRSDAVRAARRRIAAAR